jgi:hypothetical protein
MAQPVPIGMPRQRRAPELPRLIVRPEILAQPGAVARALGQLAEGLDALRNHVELLDQHLSREINNFRPGRNAVVTGVAPAAAANTFGAATEILPTEGYAVLASVVHLALTSGGVFGIETLTARVTATFTDDTTASVEKPFMAAGGETVFTNAELYALIKDAVGVVKLAVDARSTLANSTATAGAKVGALNG